MKISTGFLAFLVIILSACGGGSDATAPITAPPTTPPAVVNTITISASKADIDSGQVETLLATGLSSDGKIVSDGVVSWESKDPNVVTVTVTGSRTATFTGIHPGVAQISASLQGISTSTMITVSVVVPGQNVGTTAAFLYSTLNGMEFLPLPDNALSTTATAVNNLGQVVGTVVYSVGPSHAFLWSRDKGMMDLGVFPGSTTTSATAISQDGQVVGVAYIAVEKRFHSFRWTQATGMTEIGGTLPSASLYATGINSSGQVVGHEFSDGSNVIRPFLWTQSDGIRYLSSGISGEAFPSAINDAGQIAGALGDGDYGYEDVVIWSVSGSRKDFGDYGSGAFAISANGNLAGTNGVARAWTSAGVGRFVPGLTTDFYSLARGINDDATVVGDIQVWEKTGSGSSTRYVDHSHGFVFSTADGYKELLPPRGRIALHVTGINNGGQIVGYVQ